MAVYYIDTSAANDGDGSSHAQAASPGAAGAFNTPAGHLGSAGDVFWVRRVTAAKVLAATNFNVATKYIGFPLPGDDYYATRPAGAAAAWDADSAQYPTWEHTASAAGDMFAFSAGTGQEVHRIYFKKSTTSSGAYNVIGVNAGGILLKTVYAEAAHNYIGTITCWSINTNSGTLTSMYNCQGYVSNAQVIANIMVLQNVNLYLYCKGFVTNTSSVFNYGLNHTVASAAKTQILYAEGCIFQGMGAAGSGLILAGFAGNLARLHFYNCTFKSAASTAINCSAVGNVPLTVFNNCSITGGAGINFQGGSVATTDVTSLGASSWHFKQFVQDVAGTYGIQLRSHIGSCYLENVTFKAGNTNDIFTLGSNILLRNATFLSSPEVNVTPMRNIYCLDYGGNKGAFKAWQNNLVISSNATARTGGSSYSIKLEPQAVYDIADEIIGQCGIPGQETLYASVPVGTYTITIYGAHKLWGATPPTQKDIWFEGSYYAGASGATVTAFSTRDLTGTALVTDNSTWTGDTSLTIFKITKTITTGQASLVPIRIYMSKYVSTAYIYIDPKITVA